LKALYENLLLDAATLIAGSEDFNFPITNILVASSNITFRSVTASTTTTLTFAASVTLNSLGIANHNLGGIKIETFLAAAPDLNTGVISTIYDTDVLYFTETTCDEILITTYGQLVLTQRLGRLYMGLALELPDPIAHYNEGLIFTSERLESDWGTVYGSGGVVLKPLDPMTFLARTQAMKESIITMLRFIKIITTCLSM